MNKRPLSITIIGWLFIVTGGVGLAYHCPEINIQQPFEVDSFWNCFFCFVRFLAVLGGLFLLLGFNWARCMLVAWMGFHIVISALNSIFQLLMHCLIFGAILYFLFRPRASAYFRRKSEKSSLTPEVGNVREP